jgi:hypothetical protein
VGLRNYKNFHNTLSQGIEKEIKLRLFTVQKAFKLGNTEALYIKHCKHLIEQKLNWPDSSHWKQRDYLNLINLLESKTGIALSLSTVKRIWKSNYEGTPHPATTEAFAKFLDFNSWLDFKQQHSHLPDGQVSYPPTKNKLKGKTVYRKTAILIPVILLSAIVIILFPFNYAKGPSEIVAFDPEKLEFSCDNSVSAGVPNTVLFRYDVSEVKADSFFIQQSWNQFRRDRVSKENSTLTSTYYYPGFHKAKLIANDSVIKETNVRINTKGWMALARYGYLDENPVYLQTGDEIKNGMLYVSAEHLSADKVEINRNTMVSYYYVSDFKDLSSRDFVLEAKLRCDSIINISCPHIGIVILGELDMNFIPLTVKGCVGNTSVKFGNVTKSGKNNDLSSLGVDVYDWQLVRIDVRDAVADIYVNDQPALTIQFEQDIGDIVGFAINFSGTGAIGSLKLFSGSNKQSIYSTDS